MKTGKAASPSGIVIEMIRSPGKEIMKSITNFAKRIIKEDGVPSDWTFFILSVHTWVKVMLSLETITEV